MSEEARCASLHWAAAWLMFRIASHPGIDFGAGKSQERAGPVAQTFLSRHRSDETTFCKFRGRGIVTGGLPRRLFDRQIRRLPDDDRRHRRGRADRVPPRRHRGSGERALHRRDHRRRRRLRHGQESAHRGCEPHHSVPGDARERQRRGALHRSVLRRRHRRRAYSGAAELCRHPVLRTRPDGRERNGKGRFGASRHRQGQAALRLPDSRGPPADPGGTRLQQANRALSVMTPLLAELSAIAGRAFADEGFDPALGATVVSDRTDLAQFQCNGALAAAKLAKTAPRAVAERIAARLKADGLFSKVEIAGPGFINLDVADAALVFRVTDMAADARLGAPETGKGKTLVIDFGGPNVAKPMHVGHLRATIIGDSLQRLFRANAWAVLSDVHLGDWGLPMGQLIVEIGRRGIAPVYFDAAYSGPYPPESPVTMEELEELYPAASAACKADPARLEEARNATAELQAGRPGYRALWQHFVQVSEVGLKREYGSLGVSFDLWKGEADVDP